MNRTSRIVTTILCLLGLFTGACTPNPTVIPLPPKTDSVTPPADTIPPTGCQIAADCVGIIPWMACHSVSCFTSSCVSTALPDGAPCAETSGCASQKTCLQGACQGGIAIGCNDNNPCTDALCDPAVGCVSVPKAGACDDGNPCSLADHCINNTCAGGNSVCPCEDDAQCAQWDDGNPCNGALSCLGGVCQIVPGSVVHCVATSGDPCKSTTCNPATSQCEANAAPDGTPCTDGNLCTGADSCMSGTCMGGPPNCPCTTDTDCLSYDDGNLCNGVLRCIANQCVADPTSTVLCAGGGDLCAAGACNPATGQCTDNPLAIGAACDDGNLCTINDSCVANGCVGQPLVCNDENPCTNEVCNPATGTCSTTPNTAPCDDGNVCTQSDVCQSGVCVGMQDLCVCDITSQCAPYEDNNPCTGPMICMNHMCIPDPTTTVTCDVSANTDCMTNQCNPLTGTCQLQLINEGGACFDGDPCTDGDICIGGNCTGTPLPACVCTATDPLPCGTFQKKWANDAFGSSSNIAVWPCAAGDYSGKEYAWSFVATTSTWVAVDLTSEEADTDVFVLENTGLGCVPSACVGHGEKSLAFGAQPGKEYFVVVDGQLGSNGKFDVSVTCDTSVEFNCNNGVDDDVDGKQDCNDSDCTNDPVCTFGEDCTDFVDNNNNGLIDCADPGCVDSSACVELCTPDGNAYCGLSVYWKTGGTQAENEMEYYGCGDVLNGPEFVYTFQFSKMQYVTVSLPQAFTGHQIVVLQDQNNQCGSNGCLLSGSYEVNFLAMAGVTYYFVVDGMNGASGDYHIKVKCTE